MNILTVIIKNTAALDYVLPVLCSLRMEYQNANIYLLFCRSERQTLLQGATFYSLTMQDMGIYEFDLKNEDILGKNLREIDTSERPPVFSSLKRFFRNLFAVKSDHSLTAGLQIAEKLSPDIILLDSTSSAKRHFAEGIYRYIEKYRIPVILLPHAPHHSNGTAFTRFTSKNPLPAYSRCWMPFLYDHYWDTMPNYRGRFEYIGYPGMDSTWLTYLRESCTQNPETNKIRCMFVIRRFLEKHQCRNVGDNQFVYNYDEMEKFIRLVSDGLNQLNRPYSLVIKPHPSNSIHTVEKIFSESDIYNWSITKEPIYAHLSNLDGVVSLYSTAGLISAINGVPLVMLQTSTHEHIFQWDHLKRLYTGMSYYLTDPREFNHTISEALEHKNEPKKSTSPRIRDIKHLRDFFPDGAIERATKSIKNMISSGG